MGKKSARGRPADEEEADPSDDDASTSAAPPAYSSVLRRATHKKKKVLVLCSRGVTSSFMELMEDLMKLLPHCRKDPKFDKSEPVSSLVEVAQLNSCALCLYFEARKMKDLYLWAGSVAKGPSIKFLVQQIRPMRDLRLTGNCLLGSRPILSFDGGFGARPCRAACPCRVSMSRVHAVCACPSRVESPVRVHLHGQLACRAAVKSAKESGTRSSTIHARSAPHLSVCLPCLGRVQTPRQSCS